MSTSNSIETTLFQEFNLDSETRYSAWNLIAEQDENNTVLRSYVWGSDLSGSKQGAGGVGGLLSMTDHTQTVDKTYYYAFDGNGNVDALVESTSGSIVANYDYTPFGEAVDRLTNDGGIENPFRFSTKYLDEETELYYYGYRFYDAGLGRWLNRDPIEERGGFNVYGFVGNNGVNYIDRLGLFSFPPIDFNVGFEVSGDFPLFTGVYLTLSGGMTLSEGQCCGDGDKIFSMSKLEGSVSATVEPKLIPNKWDFKVTGSVKLSGLSRCPAKKDNISFVISLRAGGAYMGGECWYDFVSGTGNCGADENAELWPYAKGSATLSGSRVTLTPTGKDCYCKAEAKAENESESQNTSSHHSMNFNQRTAHNSYTNPTKFAPPRTPPRVPTHAGPR